MAYIISNNESYFWGKIGAKGEREKENGKGKGKPTTVSVKRSGEVTRCVSFPEDPFQCSSDHSIILFP